MDPPNAMISHLRGQVEELSDEAVVIDVGGIGYEVFVPKRLLSRMPMPGKPIHLFTHDHVRDTDHQLFGFMKRDERDLFRLLLEVSGVGPKSALSLLSLMEPRELVVAIQEANVTSVARAQGVGRKTAQRVILELQNKMGAIEPLALGTPTRTGPGGDAIEALMALGASDVQAEEAVRRAQRSIPDGATTEDIVKLALRSLSIAG